LPKNLHFGRAAGGFTFPDRRVAQIITSNVKLGLSFSSATADTRPETRRRPSVF